MTIGQRSNRIGNAQYDVRFTLVEHAMQMWLPFLWATDNLVW